ncbi:hypothetical protein [Leuconostoc citreum]
MTFDEAVEELKTLSKNGADTWYGDNLEKRTHVKGHIESGSVEMLIYKLRKEYASDIYMKKSEYDFIFPLIKKGKELGATFTEFWSVYKDDRNREHLKPIFETQEKAMLIWLHPETIKVIGENNDTAKGGRNED